MTDNQGLKQHLKQEYDRTLTVPIQDASKRILNLMPGDQIPFSTNLHNGKTTEIKVKKAILTEDGEIHIAGDTVK